MSNIYITTKCSDGCLVEFENISHHGYGPNIPGIGGEDYIQLEIDNDTGMVIGWKPLTIESFKEACGIKDDEE